MANNRAAIRAALKTMLTNTTTATANVYSSRETRLWSSELPAILIYTNQESATPEAFPLRRYHRTLELSIEVKVTASENVDDEIDSLLAEVEALVLADPSIGGTVLSTVQTGTEIRVDSEAEKDIGVGVLSFECKYIS